MSKEVTRSTCGICQIGCGLLVHSDGGRITGVEGDPENPLNEGTLCAVVDYGWWFPEDGPADQYGWRKSNVNMLTDDQPPFGPEMATPNFRGIMCRVSKVLP